MDTNIEFYATVMADFKKLNESFDVDICMVIHGTTLRDVPCRCKTSSKDQRHCAGDHDVNSFGVWLIECIDLHVRAVSTLAVVRIHPI